MIWEESTLEAIYKIIGLLGGLALFLYGMRVMGDGLKGSSGGAMRVALAKVTDKRIKAFLLGLLVTVMIQSSTATIVLTVGLVGAGYLTFRQSVGIVLGANVGTAITAQIIRLMDVQAGAGSILYFFKSDNLAPFALVLGIILIMFVKKGNSATVGTILMGFGMLFVGLMNMSSAVSSMSDSLSKLLTMFETNYFLGFLSGVAVTGVIQSSSAVIGILQSIASSVGVRVCGVFAVIIGVNIGDCLTTYLVCRIGATKEQIRTCLVHIIYNVCAALFLFIAIFILRQTGVLNEAIWTRALNSGGVANLHGLFRLLPSVLFLPLSGVFANLAERIAPEKAARPEDESEIERNLRELDDRLLTNPRLALQQAEHLVGHMAELSIDNFESAMHQLYDYDEKRRTKIETQEKLIDRIADAANQYVVAISPYIKLDVDRKNQHFQIQALTCFERIGDLAINIGHNSTKLHEGGGTLSDGAKEELRIAQDAIDEILNLTSIAYKTGQTTIARQVEPLEEVIDDLIDRMRERHTERMVRNQCNISTGIEFQNVLLHLERISDQCSDLAVYQLGRDNEAISGQEHQYIHELHFAKDEEYANAFRRNSEKYFGRLADAEKRSEILREEPQDGAGTAAAEPAGEGA